MTNYNVGDKVVSYGVKDLGAGSIVLDLTTMKPRVRSGPSEPMLFEDYGYVGEHEFKVLYIPEDADPVEELAENLWDVREASLAERNLRFMPLPWPDISDDAWGVTFRALAGYVLDNYVPKTGPVVPKSEIEPVYNAVMADSAITILGKKYVPAPDHPRELIDGEGDRWIHIIDGEFACLANDERSIDRSRGDWRTRDFISDSYGGIEAEIW